MVYFFFGHIEIVKFLIQKDINVDLINENVFKLYIYYVNIKMIKNFKILTVFKKFINI
jgi:hypothetical protein